MVPIMGRRFINQGRMPRREVGSLRWPKSLKSLKGCYI